MNPIWFLILPLFVAFLVYQAYKLGTMNGQYLASRDYVERVNLWHSELIALHAKCADLQADHQQLIQHYKALND